MTDEKLTISTAYGRVRYCGPCTLNECSICLRSDCHCPHEAAPKDFIEDPSFTGCEYCGAAGHTDKDH